MRFPGQLRGYQLEVLGGLLYAMNACPGELFTVMFPRQAGKNEVSAALVSALLVSNADKGGSIVVCAPTLYPQASISFQRTLARMRRICRPLGAPVKVEGTSIRCGNATATFLSGSPQANVAGHTASLLLIGDEAQDLEEDWFNRQFRPMTASTGAATILFGTPWEDDSLLEKAAAHNRRRDEAEADATGIRWHYQVGWREVAAIVPAYGRFVEQQRERLGAAHPVFRSQYELLAGQPARRLLSPKQLEAVRGGHPGLEGPLPGERYAAGLDFGGEGRNADATVLTVVRCGGQTVDVVAVYRWQGAAFETVRTDVIALAGRWGFGRLVCDATGLGAPLTAQLAATLGRMVEPLVFTQQEKSHLGFELIGAASTGRLRVAGPETESLAALWHELRSCRSELRPNNQLWWGAGPGQHDDCVASLTLALRAAASMGPPRVALGRNRFAAG